MIYDDSVSLNILKLYHSNITVSNSEENITYLKKRMCMGLKVWKYGGFGDMIFAAGDNNIIK